MVFQPLASPASAVHLRQAKGPLLDGRPRNPPAWPSLLEGWPADLNPTFPATCSAEECGIFNIIHHSNRWEFLGQLINS
jgi:hypothetical protein